jgi:hypothetical protein
MSGYTVTISPAGDQAGPQTTIHVDTTTGAARVVELTMRAADGNGLAPQQLPVIDLAGLIAALTPGTTVPAITMAETTVAEAPVEAPARATRTRRGRAAAEKPAPRKAAAARGRRRRAAATEAAAAEAAATEAAADTVKAGRAYRRMPDQDEVVGAWQQSHSATAVAAHFGVPRHTATGWLRRLRGLGVIESADR